MPAIVEKGRWRARFAATDGDVAAAQALRHLCFIDGAGRPPRPGGLDADSFDPACRHLLVEDRRGGPPVACCRLLPLESGAGIAECYSAQYYDLGALSGFPGPMVEMGRFCIHPDHADPDILRIAWAALTRYVDATGAQMLFGCSSFAGTEAEAHLDAFALLHDRHLAPKRWLPRVKAPRVFRFAERLRRGGPDPKRGWLRMPPLLRSYLMMGGWVSDHAVVDEDLGTMHVFTGVEIGKVPRARAERLRAVAP